GAAENAAEPTGLRRYIEAVGANLVAAPWLGPRLERWNVRMRLGVRGGVRRFGRDIPRARGEHPHEPPALRQRDGAVAGWHEGDGVSIRFPGFLAGAEFGRGARVVQQQDIFVDLALTAERRTGRGFRIDNDEVLPPRV